MPPASPSPAVADPGLAARTPPFDAPFLAADVGGTNARIGLVRAAPGTRAGVELLHCRRYACAEWPSLADILADFSARACGTTPPRAAVVACAGYVQDDTIVNVNLPWQVPIGPSRARLGLQRFDVINDFEALAHAVPGLDGAAMRGIVAGAGAHRGGLAQGPMVVMGPGTGLGCAALLPGTARDPSPRILATEAAHIALAPGTPQEVEILKLLAQVSGGHVPVEHALSGPGLLKLYRAVAQLQRLPAPLATPAEVTRAALAGASQPALDALDVFCSLLGSFAGDLAILWQASGGVVLAGGILPQIEGFLQQSRFGERFLRKGVLRPFLEQVPVHLIDHGDLGVLGAARWSLTVPAPA